MLSQWDSLVLQDDVLYQKSHFLDGTTNFLQIVLLVQLCLSYIERLHADLGHFRWTKTCIAVSRRVYFPGWCSLTGLLVHSCAVCNLQQRSRQTPRQATLKSMQEFFPMAVLHTDLVGPLLEGRNSQNQNGFQYILPTVDSATRCMWLLPLCHKTAEAVATALFDEVLSRVSVASAILTDGEKNSWSVSTRGWELPTFGPQLTILRRMVSVSECTFQCRTWSPNLWVTT